MSLAVQGLRVAESDGNTILSVETMRATFAPVSSLVDGVWTFREIAILEPTARLFRNAGGVLNFSDLLRLDWPKGLRIQADMLLLRDGKILFRDAAVPGGFSHRQPHCYHGKGILHSAGHHNAFR